MDLANIEVAWEYGTQPADESAEIMRNVRAILTTPVGTCPLYRAFGIDTSFLDKPMALARNLATVEIITKVERFEPRVRVTSVKTDSDTDARLKIKVVIKRG